MASRKKRQQPENALVNNIQRNFAGWLLLLTIIVMLLPGLLDVSLTVASEVIGVVPDFIGSIFSRSSALPQLFTDEVQHWADDIVYWSDEYDLDPKLMATVMQIESCGHPEIASVAGAQGLFQVMPFHFEDGENYLDPATNALRSANFLNVCSEYANGDVGLTLACYNGGPSVTQTAFAYWPSETQRYYYWGTGIYNDAVNHYASSDTLDQWLNAGGERLCDQAAYVLGIAQ